MEIVKAGKWRAALVILIFLSAGYGVAAITNHTSDLYYDNYVATYWVNSTSTKSSNYYLGATSLNARLGGDYGALDITTTGDVEATNVNATTFYQGGTSLNDLISGTVTGTNVTESSYIIWKDGGTYYAQDGMTGVVTSNADASTIIQLCINASYYKSIYIKAGFYDILTEIDIVHPICIYGESAEIEATNRGTHLQAGAAITSIIHVNITNVSPENIESGCILENLILDGNANTNADNCLYIQVSVRTVVRRCAFIYAKVWGLKVDETHSQSFYDCTFGFNGAHATTDSGGAEVGTESALDNVVKFYSCNFEANLQDGLKQLWGNSLECYGCVFEGQYRYGINGGEHGGTDLLLKGCHFEANNAGNYVGPANMIGYLGEYAYVENCYFLEDETNTTYFLTIDQFNSIVIGVENQGTTKMFMASAKNNIFIGNPAILSADMFGGANTILRIIDSTGPKGYAATTPAVGASTVDVQNTLPYPVLVYITGIGGGVTAVGITDPAGTLVSFTKTVAVGDAYWIDINGKIRLTYAAAAPTWDWYGL